MSRENIAPTTVLWRLSGFLGRAWMWTSASRYIGKQAMALLYASEPITKEVIYCSSPARQTTLSIIIIVCMACCRGPCYTSSTWDLWLIANKTCIHMILYSIKGHARFLEPLMWTSIDTGVAATMALSDMFSCSYFVSGFNICKHCQHSGLHLMQTRLSFGTRHIPFQDFSCWFKNLRCRMSLMNMRARHHSGWGFPCQCGYFEPKTAEPGATCCAAAHCSRQNLCYIPLSLVTACQWLAWLVCCVCLWFDASRQASLRQNSTDM